MVNLLRFTWMGRLANPFNRLRCALRSQPREGQLRE